MSESDQTAIQARRPGSDKRGPKGSAAHKRGGNTRQHVLDCAARLFRTQGYAATSLRDIAAASGMKPGSLYYHFPSKEKIVIEVLDRGVGAVFDEVRRSVGLLPPEASCETQIRTAIFSHLRSLLGHHDYTSANTRIFGQVPPRIREASVALRKRYEQFWDDLLRRCAASGALRSDTDLKLLRLFLFGAMNGSLEWFRFGGKRTIEQLAKELGTVVIRGAGAPGRRGAIAPAARVRRLRA
ncbi:MAG: TetR/AcrR family transcriptional regulator [Candidatus Binataceae bacterium]|jgi:AcrR family transcriptional regulator